jgi:hypothetical protein
MTIRPATYLRDSPGIQSLTRILLGVHQGPPMNRARRGVIGLLALVLVAGCTAKSKEPTVTFEEAQQRVVALVDDTLSAALPTLPLSQPARVEHQPCDDAPGAPSQDVYLHFERNFPIDGPPADRLVADTERAWRERAMRSSLTTSSGTSRPAMPPWMATACRWSSTAPPSKPTLASAALRPATLLNVTIQGGRSGRR